MRGRLFASLLAFAAGACDVCEPWSGTLQADKLFMKECKNGNADVKGEFADEAACKAAGGTDFNELKCSYMTVIGGRPEYSTPDKCGPMQALHGYKCCGGKFSGKLLCDPCATSNGGTLQMDTLMTKNCEDASGNDVDGDFADLAACKAKGGATLTDVYCRDLLVLGTTPAYSDQAHCEQVQVAGKAKCCAGGEGSASVAASMMAPSLTSLLAAIFVTASL